MNDNYIKLPKGKFFMGTDDTNAKDREKPRHEVSIDYDIAMAKHLVTVEDYKIKGDRLLLYTSYSIKKSKFNFSRLAWAPSQ